MFVNERARAIFLIIFLCAFIPGARADSFENLAQNNSAPSTARPLLNQPPSRGLNASPLPSNSAMPLQLVPVAPPPSGQFGLPPRTLGPERNESVTSIQGLKNFYAQTGAGWGSEESTKNLPKAPSYSPGRPSAKAGEDFASDATYSLLLKGIIGWGPIKVDKFLFNAHYRYNQDWATKADQIKLFNEEWWGRNKRKSEYFLFTTSGLLRTHEFVTDLRYLHPWFQAGIFSRISFSRIGSSVLGSKYEQAETIAKSENFIPYLAFRVGQYYRGQVSLPFRTEINKEDPSLNNRSYSWKGKGRGSPNFSFNLNNSVLVPNLRSFLLLDLFLSEYNYNSINNDRTRLGFATSFDFPVYWTVRAVPKFIYFNESYPVERVRIPPYTEASEVPNAELKTQVDSLTSYGLSSYVDFSPRQRLNFDFSLEQKTSTLVEFNTKRISLKLGYTYSWPTTSYVARRVSRFSENSYAEEF